MSRFFFAVVGLFTLSCNSNKPAFEENPPFVIQEAFYQYWLAGVQEAGRGIQLELTFESIDPETTPDYLYFRGQKLTLTQDKFSKKTFRASIKFPEKEDTILDANPAMEMNNPRPTLNNDFPFELKPDEAVIAYAKSNKTRHFKVTLTKREAMAFPSSKPVDNN